MYLLFVKSPSRLPRCQSGFGCFKACPQPTCDSVVLWRRTGNYVDFRIKARLTSPSNRWVAIGFSPSGKMVGRIFSYILVFLIYWMKCKSQGHTSVLNFSEILYMKLLTVFFLKGIHLKFAQFCKGNNFFINIELCLDFSVKDQRCNVY